MHSDITVIIADDDDGHVELIKKNLIRAGLEVLIVRASDGEQAIEAVTKSIGDSYSKQILLLLDINLPIMDGFEVLCALKKDLILSKVPVIMLTTTDDPREVERCYKNGCNAFITKPLEPIKFIETIQRLGLFIQTLKLPLVANDQTAA